MLVFSFLILWVKHELFEVNNLPIFKEIGFDNISDKKEVVEIVKICLYCVEPVLGIVEAIDDVGYMGKNLLIRKPTIIAIRRTSQKYYRTFCFRNILMKVIMARRRMTKLDTISISFLH